MKNKNDLKQVVKFQGEFDVSHILKSLKFLFKIFFGLN